MPRGRVSSGVDLPPFQALLDAQGPGVYRFLIATVGPGEAYPRLRDASNLRAWILTVAQRKAIDHFRARARRAIPLAELPETPGPAVQDDGIPEIWTHVRALPAKQRTAITLRTVADLAYADIARIMGTSEEAARRNVHEALKRLRTELPA